MVATTALVVALAVAGCAGMSDTQQRTLSGAGIGTAVGAGVGAITGEWAWIKVNVPSTYSQQYGNKQQGGFLDIVQPVLKRNMLGWKDATLNLAIRLEYVDWNVGKFTDTGGNISEDIWSIVPAISFRPTAQTVIRLNYRYMQQKDLLGNPPAKTGGFQFGLSTYF